MAHDISKSYIVKFDDMIKQAYADVGGKIRGNVQTRTGVVGLKQTFNVYGKGAAKAAAAIGQDIDTMGTKTMVVDCTLGDFQASEYSNIFENDKVNFDDEQELVKVIAGALGRKEDEILIKGLNDALNKASAADDIGSIPADNVIKTDFEATGTDTGLTVDKLYEAVVALDDQGVPSEGRVIVAPARAKRSLLASVEVSSADYNAVKPLVHGQVDSFLGFKFIWIGQDVAGLKKGDAGYPSQGAAANIGNATHLVYAMHESALCLAVGNLDKQSRIDYVPQKMSYLVAAPLRAGAVVREGDGVVAIGVKL